ncbi:MAG: GntR family transcriptional regulator [Eubacteriales bacterium]|jgi:GntR family transcriptional regulator
MIIIDYRDRRPIYEQVVERFGDLIMQGVLRPDDQLPSVRQMAMELSINPNTIQRAYAELERKGFTYSVKGKGSFVAANENLLSSRKQEVWEMLDQALLNAQRVGVKEDELLQHVQDYFAQQKGGNVR